MTSSAASSAPQVIAERDVRAALRARHGWELEERTIEIARGIRATVDGIDDQHRVMVEIIARQGSNSPSRDDKIMADAAKLKLLSDHLGGGYRLAIIVCDVTLHRKFDWSQETTGLRKWHAMALKNLGVEVHRIDLPRETRLAVEEAQERQSLANQRRARPAAQHH